MIIDPFSTGKRTVKAHMIFLIGTAQVSKCIHQLISLCKHSYLLMFTFASAIDWWKSMKQLLPSKMVETDDSVRYSISEVGRLTGSGAVPRLHAEPAGTVQLMWMCLYF